MLFQSTQFDRPPKSGLKYARLNLHRKVFALWFGAEMLIQITGGAPGVAEPVRIGLSYCLCITAEFH